ncbi:MAG: hypothetical protein KDD56_06535 [Bdellovibrionales bacterium]|nr:hypothetical protein [Bdellovibrionales bacterium]
MAKFEKNDKGIVKRKQKREIGLFIDGTGLDRAARRLKKKVDLDALVKSLAPGLAPKICRYYTLIPFEDDSRQRAFLDAVAKAGLSVIVKRLPPKTINRQVSISVEMTADMIAFGLSKNHFSQLSEHIPEAHGYDSGPVPQSNNIIRDQQDSTSQSSENSSSEEVSRVVTVVCASRDLSYTFAFLNELKIETVNADFAKFNSGDILKSASKWIDLSDSETIWRDE